MDIEKVKSEKSYESELSFYKLFWAFFAFSILGYILEEIIQLIQFGYYENHQGLIYGPFSQIYGLGAVLLILISHKMHKKNIVFLYFFCSIFGGAYEYSASLIQEMFLGSVSWQYSYMMFNIHGRTNLLFSLYFGMLGVLIIKYLYPQLCKLLDKFPHKKAVVITLIVFILMSGDIFITTAAMNRGYQRYHDVAAATKFQVFLDKKYPDSYLKSISSNTHFK